MSVVKKLIGFSPEALRELELRKASTGRTQTRIINDLLLGDDRFAPFVEEAITALQTAKNLSRYDAIHDLLAEAAALRKARQTRYE